MYLFQDAGKPKKDEPRVQLLACGRSVLEAIAAAELLDKEFGVKSDVWSCPSFSELSPRRPTIASAGTACIRRPSRARRIS